MNRIASSLIVALLFLSLFAFALNIQPAKASTGTIYIRADGSIDPTGAPIRQDGDTYTLTANIVTESGLDGIVIQKGNIVVDGAHYTINATLRNGKYISSGYGIVLSGRNNVTIKNTRVTWFQFGILLDNSSNNNHVSGNIVWGIKLHKSFNNTISKNTLGGGFGGVFMTDSMYNNISTNSIANNVDGYGIHLSSSSNNTIVGNNIEQMGCGILEENSSNHNWINDNDVFGSLSSGIELHGSCFNSIHGNDVRGNSSNLNPAGVRVDYDGIRILDESNNNSLVGNTVTASYLGEYVGPQDEGGYGVMIENSSNNAVSVNIITTNERCGVALFANSSKGNSVFGNKIANNGVGFWFIEASGNSVTGNNITANEYAGIAFLNSSNNVIFHNNFVNNQEQVYDLSRDNPSIPPSINVWDNGYPSGGNYWSDYNGTDANHDGIGDTPYVIDANNIDHYPLMNQIPVPELPSFLLLPLFIIATLLTIIIFKRKVKT